MIITYEINTRELFEALLLAIILLLIGAPWWVWILYIFTIFGVTIKWKK